MNASIKFCDNCGATNRSNAKFYYACGQPQMVYASTATGLLTSAYQLKQRYRIVEKLGQGSFGAIYKVEDMLFNNATRAAKEMGMRGLNTQEVQSGIHIYDDGRGTITNCAITENTYGALDIAPECRVVLKGNQL
jgi:F-box protein 11